MPDTYPSQASALSAILCFPLCGISTLIVDIGHALKENKYRGGIWVSFMVTFYIKRHEGQ